MTPTSASGVADDPEPPCPQSCIIYSNLLNFQYMIVAIMILLMRTTTTLAMAVVGMDDDEQFSIVQYTR